MTNASSTKDKHNRAGEANDTSVMEALMEETDADTIRYILVRERKGNSLPDKEDLGEMETSIRRMFQSTVLFDDIMTNAATGEPPNYRGLLFLAITMRSHAENLYRFYHGHKPRD